MAATFGYVRVSSKDQNEARQLLAMEAFPIQKNHIYTDKQSGKNFDRPAYRQMLRRMRPGDLLVVKSIDRLGRNYTEILEQWHLLTKERGLHILVLDMPLLDTRSKNQDLTGIFISDLVLQILSYVAQAERENIHQRQAEGIAAARLRGVRFGRPPLPLPPGFQEARDAWASGRLCCRAAATSIGMTESTFRRKCLSQAKITQETCNKM